MVVNLFICKKILIFIFLLFFVSCESNRAQQTDEPSPNVQTQTPAPTAIVQEQTPENPAWVEAYADFFMQESFPPYFKLLDVDFDGIPELFFYASGYGANMWLFIILTYSENGMERIDLESDMPAYFELYSNTQTGETRWMSVMEGFRSSFSHYHNEWEWVDFNDFSEISTEFFFKWEFEGFLINEETDEYEVIYRLYENENEVSEVESEEIERRRQELFSNYELIETQQYSEYLRNLVFDPYERFIGENLNRELFVEFLLRWNNEND
ncbi:MAG: hypothetical protein LBI27_07725 [Clostridiales bacterium]|jgi:hypothetical protein|nr:hypothetical protein [Clostridiales bacterium]